MAWTQKQKDWTREFMTAAETVCSKYGVPPQVCVAQAITESGFGKRAAGFNYFGIKGEGTAGKQDWTTHEEDNTGKRTKMVQSFGVYRSMQDGIEAYCRKMTMLPNEKTPHPKFAGATMLFPNDPLKFTVWIWGVGYATAQDYVGAISYQINRIGEVMGDEKYRAPLTPEVKKMVAKLKKLPGKLKVGNEWTYPRFKATRSMLDPKNVVYALQKQQLQQLQQLSQKATESKPG